jgi:hypothetical protein
LNTSEFIVQKVSQSAYILFKQYKSSVSLVNLNTKDKTASELFYLFLYQMNEFEKKFATNVVSKAPTKLLAYSVPEN